MIELCWVGGWCGLFQKDTKEGLVKVGTKLDDKHFV